MYNLLVDWAIIPDEAFTFSVEIAIASGFLIIWILIFILRNQYPQLTKNGWIELAIGVPCIILKGVFDGLDTVAPDGLIHDIFDSLEAIFILVGLILFGVGLLRMALYSSKVWEVR